MKLHLAGPSTLNTFTGYGAGYVLVNQQRHEKSLVVMPEQPVQDWPPARFEDLEPAHFEMLLALAPEIVLLGTGAKLRFPRPEITSPLTRAGKGVEVMDMQAACRTYNILVAEGRKVAAALLIG